MKFIMTCLIVALGLLSSPYPGQEALFENNYSLSDLIICDDGDSVNDPFLYIKGGELVMAYRDSFLIIDRILGMPKEAIKETFMDLIDKPQYRVFHSDNNYEYILVYYTLPSCGQYGSDVFAYVVKYDRRLNVLEKVLNCSELKARCDLDFEKKTLEFQLENSSIHSDLSAALKKYDDRLDLLKKDTVITTIPYGLGVSDYDGDGFNELEVDYPVLAPISNIYFSPVKLRYGVDHENLILLEVNFLTESDKEIL